MYVSFDNGGHWQSFQLNLPVSPVTDIKIAHKDLILSTQGRSIWILDNLTPLHQLNETNVTSSALLFAPRQAIRTTSRGGFGRGSVLQFPQAGAAIDYYLASAPTEDITMEILDAAGKVVRKFSSVATAADDRATAREAAPADDEEGGGFRARSVPTHLDKTAGMHRFTWDLRYPGSWMSATRPEGPNGPTAVPGKYSVRLTAGTFASTQPLSFVEDPRITQDGVTTAELREQFEHNVRVRDLVSDMSKALARLRAARANATGEKLANLNDLAADLITPAIRYSKPALQTQVSYLYTLTNSTDQKIGRDAIERYNVLRKSLDERIAQLNKILGADK
jgi:hypothetical protein